MEDIKAFPQLLPFLDPMADGARVEDRGDGNFLITLTGEDGGQLLVGDVGGKLGLLASDNVIAFAQPLWAPHVCTGACSAAQHAKVAEAIVAKVDNYSTSAGPDGGNLACVWAVRKIVKEVLGFWITQSDGTAVFDPALRKCFGNEGLESGDVSPGGIIISPTSGSNIGHVGLLGTGRGDDRLVYSNSSSAAMWKQNFSVKTWRERYANKKGLPVRFFPLPQY